MTSTQIRAFQRKLLAWYRENARHDLPWRKTGDPYRIWVSEAMLQQTQVETVIPYYRRFLKIFPTLPSLAKAQVEEVLEAWSGLGYYTRAKNLHAAAQRILEEHRGKVPDQVEELLHLPGIGRTTAGAIASIAYDRPAPILEGNVIRVLTRYFGIREDPRKPAVQRRLWAISQRLVSPASPGKMNQALMEVGALICTPGDPQCGVCPLTLGCRARRFGWQGRIPFPKKPAPRKKITLLCGILEKEDEILLARRPLNELLPGLWELPGGEKDSEETDAEALIRCLKERLGLKVEPRACLGITRQILSHRELEIRAYACQWGGPLHVRWYTQVRWVPKSSLKNASLHSGMSKLLATVYQSLR